MLITINDPYYFSYNSDFYLACAARKPFRKTNRQKTLFLLIVRPEKAPFPESPQATPVNTYTHEWLPKIL